MIIVSAEEFQTMYDDAEVVSREPWRHGYHETVVVLRADDHYIATISVHCSEGLQLGNTVTLYPAKRVPSFTWVQR